MQASFFDMVGSADATAHTTGLEALHAAEIGRELSGLTPALDVAGHRTAGTRASQSAVTATVGCLRQFTMVCAGREADLVHAAGDSAVTGSSCQSFYGSCKVSDEARSAGLTISFPCISDEARSAALTIGYPCISDEARSAGLTISYPCISDEAQEASAAMPTYSWPCISEEAQEASAPMPTAAYPCISEEAQEASAPMPTAAYPCIAEEAQEASVPPYTMYPCNFVEA